MLNRKNQKDIICEKDWKKNIFTLNFNSLRNKWENVREYRKNFKNYS